MTHTSTHLSLASPSEHPPAVELTAHHSFMRNRYKRCQLTSASVSLRTSLLPPPNRVFLCLPSGLKGLEQPGFGSGQKWRRTLVNLCGGWGKRLVFPGKAANCAFITIPLPIHQNWILGLAQLFRWFIGEGHRLLFQRTPVWFPTPCFGGSHL